MSNKARATIPPKSPGRPKGVPNKITGQVKDMVRLALEKAGGVDYLARQADLNPSAFMMLVGKLMPLQMAGEVRYSYDLSSIADEYLAELERVFVAARSAAGDQGGDGEAQPDSIH